MEGQIMDRDTSAPVYTTLRSSNFMKNLLMTQSWLTEFEMKAMLELKEECQTISYLHEIFTEKKIVDPIVMAHEAVKQLFRKHLSNDTCCMFLDSWLTTGTFISSEINWNTVPSLLQNKFDVERDKGCLVARYNCDEKQSGRKFTVEVVLANVELYTRSYGCVVRTEGRTIRLSNACMKPDAYEEYVLLESWDNVTVLVGATFLNHVQVTQGRVMVLVSNIDHISVVANILRNFATIEESPLKWEEIGKDARKRLIKIEFFMLRSEKIRVHPNQLKHLAGIQLIDALRGNNPQICNMESVENTKRLYIPRWYSVGEFEKHSISPDVTYIIFNAKEEDVNEICKYFDEDLDYIHKLEELKYLKYHQINVWITHEFDCNAAVKFLKTLRITNVQFLKHKEGSLVKITNKWDHDLKEVLFIGKPGAGKSRVLNHLFENCLLPTILVTARDINDHFQTTLSKNDASVKNFILKKLCTTKFDRVVMEPVIKSLKIVVLIDDANNPNDIDRFREFFNNKLFGIDGVSVVYAIRNCNRNTARMKLLGGGKIVELIKISKSDKVSLIERSFKYMGPLDFETASLSTRISIKYDHLMHHMPPLIWTAIGEAYKKRVQKLHSKRMQKYLDLNVKKSEIYCTFLELYFKDFLHTTGTFTQNFDEFQNMHVYAAIKKKFPFLTSMLQLQFTLELQEEFDIIECEDFIAYLEDLFIWNVLIGKFGDSSVQSWNSFSDDFIERYVKPPSTSAHLNDLLGHLESPIAFMFDIRKFDIAKIVLLCGKYPNICRVLYNSFLHDSNKIFFLNWCRTTRALRVNVAKLVNSHHFTNERELSIPNILLLCSAYLGFAKLFEFTMENLIHDVSETRDLPLRYQQSFKTVLHLLLFESRDNDITTVEEKKDIVKYMIKRDPDAVNARDYYGNTPMLETNVHFELVQCLIENGGTLLETDYRRRNLLDNNDDNPQLISWLIFNFEDIYCSLVMNFRVNSQIENHDVNEDENLSEDNCSFEMAEILMCEINTGEDPYTHLGQIATHVVEALKSGIRSDTFDEFLLTKVLAVEEMAFKHNYLCRIINRSIPDEAPYSVGVAHHPLLCTRSSPFVIACLYGYSNITSLLGRVFSVDWLKHLDELQLAYVFEALDEYGQKDLLLNIFTKLKEAQYKISCPLVRHSLVSGSLNLFQTYMEDFKFSPEQLVQLDSSSGFGALHFLLKNSIHDTKEVVKRKLNLFNYLSKVAPTSLEAIDKRGRTGLLVEGVHYGLIRHFIKNKIVNENATDNDNHNVLNVCLDHIAKFSLYLGENAYDHECSHYDHVLFLARSLRQVNALANKQINNVMKGHRKWISDEIKELRKVGFQLEDDIKSFSDESDEVAGRNKKGSRETMEVLDSSILRCGSDSSCTEARGDKIVVSDSTSETSAMKSDETVNLKKRKYIEMDVV